MDELRKKMKPLPCAVCGKPNMPEHDCYVEAQAEIAELVEMLKYSYDLIEFEEDAKPIRELLNKHKGEI